MTSGLFEARTLAPANRFLEEAGAEERQEVGRIIDRLLCYDPYIDNKTKIVFPLPPVMLTLYTDGTLWIMYRLHGNTEIRIWNIGRADEEPEPYRD